MPKEIKKLTEELKAEAMGGTYWTVTDKVSQELLEKIEKMAEIVIQIAKKLDDDIADITKRIAELENH